MSLEIYALSLHLLVNWSLIIQESLIFWSTLSYFFHYKRVYQRCRPTGLERAGRETEEKGRGKQKDRREGKKEIHKKSRRKRGCRLCSPCDFIISIPEIMENNTTPDIFHENFSRKDRKEVIYRGKVIQREPEGGLSIRLLLVMTIWPQPCTVICYLKFTNQLCWLMLLKKCNVDQQHLCQIRACRIQKLRIYLITTELESTF